MALSSQLRSLICRLPLRLASAIRAAPVFCLFPRAFQSFGETTLGDGSGEVDTQVNIQAGTSTTNTLNFRTYPGGSASGDASIQSIRGSGVLYTSLVGYQRFSIADSIVVDITSAGADVYGRTYNAPIGAPTGLADGMTWFQLSDAKYKVREGGMTKNIVQTAAAQANSTATTVAGLVTDFNAMLAKLRAATLIAP